MSYLLLGFKVVQVIDVGTPGKLVSSVCYDRPKQQVCVYLQPFWR